MYTRKNAQVVTNLQQTCSNAVPTTCQQDVFALLVPSLLTTCYKAVELNGLVTSCYRPAIQQFVNKLRVTTLQQLDKITALLHLVDNLLQACCEQILLTSCEIFTCVLCIRNSLIRTQYTTATRFESNACFAD
jgi:hypothetical protein